MNVEQKIAFRQLVSDVLMYMLDSARTDSEILEVQEKLDTAVTKLINANLQQLLPGQAPVYIMGAGDKTTWRVLIAGVLLTIGKPECSLGVVIDMIKDLEKWVEDTIERTLREYAGKPKVSITRLRDLPN
jgi:hypothetical protein